MPAHPHQDRTGTASSPPASSQADSLQQLGPEDSDGDESEEDKDVRLNGPWTAVGKRGKPLKEKKKRERSSPNEQPQVATAAGLPGRSDSRPSTPHRRMHQHVSSSPPCKRHMKESTNQHEDSMDVAADERPDLMDIDSTTSPAPRC